MRRTHINYLKAMVDSVKFDGLKVIDQKHFFEIHPPIDKIKQSLPCVTIVRVTCDNSLDARLKKENRLAPIVVADKKYLRSLVKHFSEDYRYSLIIYVKDATRDVISEPGKPGVIDQCKLYLSQNNRVGGDELPTDLRSLDSEGNALPIEQQLIQPECNVDIGKTDVDTDLADLGIYMLSIEIMFHDGLYSIKEEDTLYNGTMKIEQPIGVTTT